MVFIMTLNCAAIKDEVAEVKAEMLEAVGTSVGGIGLADEEATTVRGGTTVTLVEGAKVGILVKL